MTDTSLHLAKLGRRKSSQRGNPRPVMFMFCPATLLLALAGTSSTRAFVVFPSTTTTPPSPTPRASSACRSDFGACSSGAAGSSSSSSSSSRLSVLRSLAAEPATSTSTWPGGSNSSTARGARRRRRRQSTSLSTSSAAGVEKTWPPSAPNQAGTKIDEREALPELNHDEVRRYSRHLILPQVGVNGQRRLKASSVLAVGTGGLGSPALLYLAAAGVGRLGIVDDDVVDESNLQRQVIHGTSTLGKPKVDSARDRMLDVNPHVKVETFHEQLTSDNALRICDGYDVILDGSDNFPTKYLVNDACEILGIPNVYGAILGFEGQMSVFTYKDGPTYRDLLPTPPPPGLVPSCAEGGVLGILPGVVGCIQATEVIKILLGKGDVLSGRLLVYDALKMSFKESDLRKIPGRPPVTDLVDYQGFCGFSAKPTATPSGGNPAAAAFSAAAVGDNPEEPEPEEEKPEGFQRLSPQEVMERMGAGWAPYVLDVRLPQEAEIASLPFVDRVCPHRKVATIADELPAKGDLLVHCKVGGRSAKACAALSEHGIPASRLYNMEGGIIRWAKEVDNSLAVY